MNSCNNYNISCPYALSRGAAENASLPCFATQEQCDNWRMYRKIIPANPNTINEGNLENIAENREPREKEICEECEE